MDANCNPNARNHVCPCGQASLCSCARTPHPKKKQLLGDLLNCTCKSPQLPNARILLKEKVSFSCIVCTTAQQAHK
uniref:Uncharacterized protein n=1 Tax=Nelumbo nucifera TaxID=4432 RepID=A0A822XFJ0_NELNU|nr:TPA_asm: hypothetical protein HUJ06_019324 [Nelumbo nucifera]DAD17863.1 TPA_asm: hypothetical protein HUJ06_019326 [Nelumbo nucifera]